MAIDRSIYKTASSEEMQSVSDEMKARQVSEKVSFIKVEPGINEFRLFPAPSKASSNLFYYPLVTSFLPIMVEEYDRDKKEKTGKMVEKRKPIFNAKVHGGFERDLVEEYIRIASDYFQQTLDKKEAVVKIKLITDFKMGIKPSTSWVSYAYKLTGSAKTYGRLQMTDGVHKQMDNLCLRQGEKGQPIVVDLFSHIDSGKSIQWISDPNNSDNKQKNRIQILFEKDCPLTDDELEMLESWEPLEKLYKNCYKRSDFKYQIEGLKRFDSNNNLGIFDLPSFQSIIDSFVDELEALLPEEDEDSKEIVDDQKITEKETVSTVNVKKADENIPAIIAGMKRAELVNLIECLNIEVAIKPSMTPTILRKIIVENICSEYELEANDIESLTGIIQNVLDEASTEVGEVSSVVEKTELSSNNEDVNSTDDLMSRYMN